jgi:nucleotidyltransferase substrate binding protein (TIGR01987 family)
MNNVSSYQLKFLRFKQRLVNLNQSVSFLKETIISTAEPRIKNIATIKAFELAFELCWKTLKDLLEYQGITAATPRDVIKEAFKTGYISDGQVWMDLLDRRNELVHVYNEDQSIRSASEIESIAIPHFEHLLQVLNNFKAES